MKSITKPRIAGLFGVFVAAAVLIAALTSGIGHASVPSDSVAVVDGKDITKAEFARSLEQAAKRQGLSTVPAVGDPQYSQIRDQALGDLLDIAWIQDEAADQGVSVSDRQVADQLAQTKKQNFKTEADYQKFLDQSGFTQEDVNLRIKLQLLSQAIQQKISSNVPDVSDSDVQDFYNQNKSQFQQPEQRDIRVVLNKDRSKVEEAQKALQADNSPDNWNKVAAKDSTDASSKDKGGVRQGITPGVLEGDLDKAVFAAGQGQVSDIVQTPLGYYVFQVDKITPATTQSLDSVKAQLKQQLQGQNQQTAFSAFIEDYRSKWANVTICADGFIIDRCDNFTGAPSGQTKCTAAQVKQTGCPPPVVERNPLAPGSSTAGALGGQSGGAPQRPHPAGSGATPPVPGGIQGGVPGAVPQGAAPTGAAPTGAAPTGAAPTGQ